MKKMLKFNFGKISLYFLVYSMSWLFNLNIDYVRVLFFTDSYFINVYIAQLAQIIGGLSIYLYQYKAFNKNENTKYFGLELIYNKTNIKQKDKPLKILILIVLASIFDFFLIIIEYYTCLEIKPKISRFF